MKKDPFQIVADEITLIRGEIATLQRTSLDRDEAAELHQYFMRDVEELRETYTESPEYFKAALKADRDQMVLDATQAATEAAQSVMVKIRQDLESERAKLSRTAGEARKEVWRWFGGFWVWLTSMLATGAVIGALGLAWIQGRHDANAFGKFPGVYCGGAGGQVVEQNDGSSFCAVWITKID